MAKDSRNVSSGEADRSDEATSLETIIRRRARGLIDAIVEEELEAALGAASSARVGMRSPAGETFEIDRARVKLPHGFQIRQDGKITSPSPAP